MRFSKYLAGGALVLNAIVAWADNVGSVGTTYPIAEQSALDMILGKLKAKEKNGELKRMQEEVTRRSMNSIKNIPPVEGLEIVHSRSVRQLDPTVSYPQAIKTDEGKVVVPAGSKINPLMVTRLSKTLVFFDGRDPSQREAVSRLMDRGGPSKYRPILVGGSWLDLTKKWKTQVYFDQHGVLSKRFGIRAVPSLIYQQGQFLAVEEVPSKELMK